MSRLSSLKKRASDAMHKRTDKKNRVPVVIDGENHADARAWAKDKIDELLKARDILTPVSDADGAGSFSTKYVDRCKSNFKYFHNLRRLM